MWMKDFTDSSYYTKKTNELIRQSMSQLTQRLHVTEAELKQTSRQVSILTETVKQQQQQIEELKKKSSTQEKVTRRTNIKIDGLPEVDEEHTPTLVKEFLKDNLSLHVQQGDIVSAERMGMKKTDSIKPRNVRVKFSSIWKKREVCQRKKLLKELKDVKIYINEDLTQEAASIYFQARKMVKEKSLWAAYTLDGQVFVKTHKDEKKGNKIDHVEQLAYFTHDTTISNRTQSKEEANSTTSSEMSIDRVRLELSKSS